MQQTGRPGPAIWLRPRQSVKIHRQPEGGMDPGTGIRNRGKYDDDQRNAN